MIENLKTLTTLTVVILLSNYTSCEEYAFKASFELNTSELKDLVIQTQCKRASSDIFYLFDKNFKEATELPKTYYESSLRHMLDTAKKFKYDTFEEAIVKSIFDNYRECVVSKAAIIVEADRVREELKTPLDEFKTKLDEAINKTGEEDQKKLFNTYNTIDGYVEIEKTDEDFPTKLAKIIAKKYGETFKALYITLKNKKMIPKSIAKKLEIKRLDAKLGKSEIEASESPTLKTTIDDMELILPSGANCEATEIDVGTEYELDVVIKEKDKSAILNKEVKRKAEQSDYAVVDQEVNLTTISSAISVQFINKYSAKILENHKLQFKSCKYYYDYEGKARIHLDLDLVAKRLLV